MLEIASSPKTLLTTAIRDFFSNMLELYVDRMRVYFYTSIMRSVAFILLIVLGFAVLAPMASFTFVIVNDGRSSLVNLDVCHSAAPALSAHGEMPCVGLMFGNSAPAFSISFSEPEHPVYTELILSSRNEHPPRS